jgi:tetratricopeptide (TPR) repeat protein
VQGLLDFDVAIEPFADGYRARVVASPAGEAHADFALPFTDTDVENFVLKVGMSIGRGRRQARRIQSDERRLLEEFGDRLFQAAFCGPVRDCLRLSRAVAESRGSGLRIRLRLPGTLANVPWEYLYDAQYGFIGLSPETVLVRYVEMPARVSPFAISPPLRVLAMISAPDDLPELQGEQEWGKLTGALSDLADRGMVQVDRLEAGTLAALQRPLRLREYHVLHFVGHGVYDEAAQDGALALEGADGKTRLVTGRDLGLMIRGHRSLRLVVLNACEGARNARDDPLGGVAQALVRQGIPAVIAMQFEISDPAALVFSRSFYQAIADGLPVDAAMVEARVAMFAEGHEVEWATPVLYLRSPDGRIFTVGPVPETEPQAREDAERQAREDTEQEAREDAERQARGDAEQEAPEGAEGQARQDAERQAHEDAERQAHEDAERQARDDAERQARDDAERQARDDADHQAREDAERQAWDMATYYTLACAAVDTRDWDQALIWLTMIADVDPGYRDVQERAEDARKQQQITRWQAEVRRLHQDAQWAAVVRAGQRLHVLDPAAADPDGLVTSARTKLTAAEQAQGLDADYETALRLLDAGKWQEAIGALERVAQVNPVYRATPALLARARRNLGAAKPPPKPPSSPPGGQRRTATLAADADAHVDRGWKLYEQGRYAEAEAAYREAIRLNPASAVARSNLGTVLRDLKRYPEAEAAYREAIRLNPASAQTHSNLGITLNDLKRYPEAEAACRDAIRLDPRLTYAHNNLGIVLRDLNRLPEAEAAFREAVRLGPSSAVTHFNLGRILHDLKRYPEAEAAYREAIRLSPGSASDHYQLGLLLQEVKRYREAGDAFREAIRLDPGKTEAKESLARLPRRWRSPQLAWGSTNSGAPELQAREVARLAPLVDVAEVRRGAPVVPAAQRELLPVEVPLVVVVAGGAVGQE